MGKTTARKRDAQQSPPLFTKSLAKSARLVSGDTPRSSVDPFPSHSRPTPQECRAVRDDLFSLHGFPQEFAKYRQLRQCRLDARFFSGDECVEAEPSYCKINDATPRSERESVLDGLVSTLLSQNTTDSNSKRAFASLKSAFPTWEDVLAAEPKCIEETIRCGGLASTKSSCIRNILTCLLEKKGNLCLEYLRDLSVDEIKAELSCFKGIGPKTVACVLMFNLERDDFPVDTHVFQISKAMGWIPESADRSRAYLHLNLRIPNELKFDLNCLMFTHGKLCRKCVTPGQKKSHDTSSCPLLNYRQTFGAS